MRRLAIVAALLAIAACSSDRDLRTAAGGLGADALSAIAHFALGF